MVTMALIPNPRPDKYGGVVVEDGRVVGFTSRGSRGENYHFIGIQVADAKVFAALDGRRAGGNGDAAVSAAHPGEARTPSPPMSSTRASGTSARPPTISDRRSSWPESKGIGWSAERT